MFVRSLTLARRTISPRGIALVAAAVTGAVFALPMVGAAGCGSDSRALIQQTQPLNGATAQDVTVTPSITLVDGAVVDLLPAEARKVVLYDVTDGAKKTVAGNVVAEGTTITYEAAEALPAGHRFLLEVQQQGCLSSGECSPTVTGEHFEEIDGSEWPEEPVTWPFGLTFSTGSGPRVRAAYLDGQRIVIRFSQPMNPAVTEKAIQIEDIAGEPLALAQPLWLDQRSVQVVVETPLEVASIYSLTVRRDAVGQDGTLLDGDGDGKPGGPEDSFTTRFTGSQRVIRSRLKP